jgi:hypothetical protein
MDPNTRVMKIAVMADGRITIDGSSVVTMDEVHSLLKGLGEQKGVVWYYREAGASEGPQQAPEVIQSIVQNRLPIRLSSKPDYSDAIGPNGQPIPNR